MVSAPCASSSSGASDVSGTSAVPCQASGVSCGAVKGSDLLCGCSVGDEQRAECSNFSWSDADGRQIRVDAAEVVLQHVEQRRQVGLAQMQVGEDWLRIDALRSVGVP